MESVRQYTLNVALTTCAMANATPGSGILGKNDDRFRASK